jgi:hypothetical protein
MPVFWEICDDRDQSLPRIGDPTLADPILDRPVHNAYRTVTPGESMR